jgi:hypothetical protein
MRYYDLSKNWRKVRPHLNNPKVVETLHRDFNRYTYGRWRQKFPSDRDQYPFDFESCGWWCEHRERRPQYWKYCKHAACHWLVNFNLELAQLVLPKKPWRIITSVKHSTVWDGDDTLFDFNFQAMGIPPDECFQDANKKMKKPGQHIVCHFAQHYTKEP